jgi:CHAT domain-containing protein/Flp pilus assembly protein TadD
VIGSLVALALAMQSPAADSLRLLARRLPATALAVEARARPLLVREATADALRAADLETARALASAYAAGWNDSFLVREVARFAAWPPERRAAKLRADSVRRAGVAAYSRDGPAAAIVIWRRALTRATAIPDTVGMPAVAGNLGAGYVAEGQPDSARRYLTRARTLAAAVGDVRVEANAVGSLADLSVEQGDLVAARQGYARALGLRERIGDTRGVAAVYNNLGLLAQQVGELNEARRQFEAALALNQREGRDEVAATNLVNLAGLASIDGDFARAERLYRDALATWRAQEQWAEAASALHGLGNLEMRRGDYPAARQALRESLDIYEQTGPLADALAVQQQLAAVLAAAGDLQGALDELRQAQSQADSARASPAVRAGIALARADLAAQLNARAEAERLYARAEFLYRQAGDPGGEAEAQQGRGLLFLAREDFARAQALLERALRTEDLAGNARSAALTRLSLGLVASERGDGAAARRQLARAAADLDRLGDPVAAAVALGEQGALEASLGRAVAAESLYRAALGRLEGRPAPEVAWRLHLGLGLARRARGAPDDAARALRAAAVEIERPTHSLALAERRSGFLADKWDVYVQLALTESARGRTGAAFDASEGLRAREMLDILSRGRVTAPSDTAAELVTREQDLRRRIAELTSELDAGATGAELLRGPDVSLATGAARDALLRAQEQYTELLLELRELAPRHAALVAREPADWRDAARRLGPAEALVEYLVSDSGSVAFVVTRDTIVVVDLGATRRTLARLVEFARGTLEPRGSGSADSLWRAPLRQLHRHLIAPVLDAGVLGGVTRLVLVPHAELHYLPFGALLEGDGQSRFLIERYELAVTPSASVWLALGDRPVQPRGAATLVLAPRPDALPASRAEADAIERLVGRDVRVLTGTNATEEALRREAGAHRVLHLATYGVLNKHNPLFSFVELQSAGDSDGRLEAHEVFGLDLSADLVVLSACQTGLASGALADVPAGDDWVGLTRAFLHAGAAHVVATLWPVQDLATAALMERFYEGYAEAADPTRALAEAQRALLAAPATAHPFYWAGLVSVGGAR